MSQPTNRPRVLGPLVHTPQCPSWILQRQRGVGGEKGGGGGKGGEGALGRVGPLEAEAAILRKIGTEKTRRGGAHYAQTQPRAGGKQGLGGIEREGLLKAAGMNPASAARYAPLLRYTTTDYLISRAVRNHSTDKKGRKAACGGGRGAVCEWRRGAQRGGISGKRARKWAIQNAVERPPKSPCEAPRARTHQRR